MPANKEKRKSDFIKWMQTQPKMDDPTDFYSEATINQYANKLKNGLKNIEIDKYRNTNCFEISDDNIIRDIIEDLTSNYSKIKMSNTLIYSLYFYKNFLFEQSNPYFNGEFEFLRKLKIIISDYKKNFNNISKNEQNKWIAEGWYKQNWNINLTDFGKMVENSFLKMAPYLSTVNYFAYKKVVDFSKEYPKEMKNIFSYLYDESKSLEDRYTAFREKCDEYIDAERIKYKRENINHSQDNHAISIYLYCRYPEKYYIYVSNPYDIFRLRMGYKVNWNKPNTSVSKMESYFEMCDKILKVIKNDEELITLNKNRLGSDKYDDSSLHLLVFDIIYYTAKYLDDVEFKNLMEDNEREDKPLLTIPMWRGILSDNEITTTEDLNMIDEMLHLGECTIQELADSNNKTRSYYDTVARRFITRILKKMDYREGIFKDSTGYFSIFCTGKEVTINGKYTTAWTIRKELEEAYKSMHKENIENKTDVELNTILYGPPGTGKTYHTVIYAVAIIENKSVSSIEKEDYEEVLKRYNKYKDDKLIDFITFHQSFGYEDFIEGIKPQMIEDNGEIESQGDIAYTVKDGIFKEFCKNRYETNNELKSFDIGKNATIWKVSLAGTGDNPVRRYCLDNGCIRIGWDDYGESVTDDTNYTLGGKSPLNAFINTMKIGDIILSCYSAWEIDAIGVVTSEYEWDDSFDRYKRKRKVNWIVKDIKENIIDLNGGMSMTLCSVYKMPRVQLSDLAEIIKKYRSDIETFDDIKKNKVFIIDEINRGNISKILGELITLIEPTKRIGASEEMRAKLPYSNESFGIPSNIYILGTMNTADRSIAMIDTALRRRFAFKEMMPNTSLLAGIDVEGIIIEDMLEVLNRRIEVLYDREHTIGHAYFMKLKENPTMEVLGDIFKNNIIPLLQEYFYEDYEKIRLVLGDNQKAPDNQFICEKEIDYLNLFGDTDIDFDEKKVYEINEDAFYNVNAYMISAL